MREAELPVPTGSLDMLKTAAIFGADAVCIGGEAFGLRTRVYNLSRNDTKEGIAFAHTRRAKACMTANVLAHDGDLPGVEAYFEELEEIGPDALIISDPGVFTVAKKVLPGMEIHINTQANNTGYGTYLFWHKPGARRVVTVRELSLGEIREIWEHIPEDMKIKSFTHGTIRISYSGRYLLSNFSVGKDANQDACTYPCRQKYSIVEETRPDEHMSVYENEHGTYIFDSKGLYMIGHIPEMMDMGIDSFRIEGGMKTAPYIATVARTYREAVDDYKKDLQLHRDYTEWYRREIGKYTCRKLTTGLYFGKPIENAQTYDNNTYVKNYAYLGTVLEVDGRGRHLIQQKNKFCVDDTIEVMKLDGHSPELTVAGMEDEESNTQDSVPHLKQVFWIDLEMDADLEVYDILRKREEST